MHLFSPRTTVLFVVSVFPANYPVYLLKSGPGIKLQAHREWLVLGNKKKNKNQEPVVLGVPADS